MLSLPLLIPKPSFLRILNDGLILLDRCMPFDWRWWIEIHGTGVLRASFPIQLDVIKHFTFQLPTWSPSLNNLFPENICNIFLEALNSPCHVTQPRNFALHSLWMQLRETVWGLHTDFSVGEKGFETHLDQNDKITL